MKRSPVPNLVLDPVRESLISSSGALLLREAIRVAGLDRDLSYALSPWRASRAVHDPGEVLLDVAIAVAMGGDCLADVAAVRAQPAVFGPVASDPTVSRLFAALAVDVAEAVAAIRGVRARARATVWARRRPLAGTPGRRAGAQVIVDIDATLVTAHSDKQGAEPTFKRGYGFAPMCAFVDHGEHGTGEALTVDLRPGKASPWNSVDHLATLDAALAQLPEHERGQVLVRADTGACSKAFLHRITDLGLEYSIGFPGRECVQAAIEVIPEQAWRAAVDGDGQPRDGAQVAELTAWMPTPTKPTRSPARFEPQEWPAGMRIIARRERPHPGAQLRLTDHNGWRITCFATNTPRWAGWRLADLEVRHRQRARCEDRICNLKDTGLRNLPFHGYDRNRLWSRSSHWPPTCSPGPRPWPSTSVSRPAMGTQTTAVPDPRRRRPDHPLRSPKTTPPAPTRLAMESAHRHRLGRAPHHLIHPPPETMTRRTGDTSAGGGGQPCPQVLNRPQPCSSPQQAARRNIEASSE